MRKLVVFFLSVVLLSACESKQDSVVKLETSEGIIRVKLYNETPLHRANFLKLAKDGFYEGILFHRVIEHFMIQAGDPDSKGARAGARLGSKEIGYVVKAEILPQFFHRKGVLAAARESDNVNPERSSSGSHFYIAQGRAYTEHELDSLVEMINGKRQAAFFEKLMKRHEIDILKMQSAKDMKGLENLNELISGEVSKLFVGEKLVLSEEQRRAYTTVGGIPHLDGAYTVFGEVVEGLDVVDRIAALPTDENNRPLKDVVILNMKVE